MPTHQRRYTVEEYYEMEDADLSGVRHEFRDGEIVAMPGGTVEHSQICVNLIASISTQLRGTPCQVFESNLRSRIEPSRRNVYPDLTIVCGPVQRDPRDKSKGTILNPRVVIEVLSPSTEKYDRTEKRDHYLKVPTLEMHVLVEQDQPRVESVTRTPDGRWELDYASGLDGVLRLPVLKIEVSLRDVYDRVEFPPSPPLPAAES
ncbi:MAG TPA: Uma2 family endonuclease [Tepidisphaeraceae bacterium]